MAINYNGDPSSGRNSGVRWMRRLESQASIVEAASTIERDAALIAKSMSHVHGGKWQVRVDHQRKMVMVWAT